MYIAIATVVLLLGLLLWRRAQTNLPYPPGPPPKPLIGNLPDIPREREALAYSAMADTYGDILRLGVLGKNIIVVSSFEALTELFHKRSVNYSDRPHSTMMNKLMDLEWIFAFRSYGNEWRDHRKLFHSQFQEFVVPEFRQTQARAAHKLAHEVIQSPEKLFHHLHMHVGGVLMDITYAMGMNPRTEKLINMADDVIMAWSKVATPGAYLVDVIPIMRYIPEWLVPGRGGFQREARVCKESAVEARNRPFNEVVSEMKHGTAKPSFVSKLLSQAGPNPDLEMMRATAGTVYFGRTEAVSICLRTFILAMVTYPDVQAKAKRELDSVVGRDRLPGFEDMDALPYINAIVKEVMRWNPPAPMAIPHVTVKDDEFRGYHIPGGSVVIGNLWKILHNPEVYPDPMRFTPERFTTGVKGGDLATAEEHLEAVYGLGRRICPGRFAAVSQLFITIATLLSVFDILPGADENGNKVTVEPDFTFSYASHPAPFKHSMVPRGEYVKSLLELAD
ncbi:cytochrome P450 [Gloeophyllum trabeum ATCC 11539]|uniref:Cytochrome P450 n=1 Tax=Gloeophyllum trabeum (strain ATCC 11539 / FP-39264 / Madison 617) TaxID=670483 RepID=S7PYG9_GLOTA|nr:cytochrome P450 [Gloeophyllum trabeum ATCC 11539]EPQ52488.1 cytochrome P450 [Gloeophyllum trabeum ATCC 11539]